MLNELDQHLHLMVKHFFFFKLGDRYVQQSNLCSMGAPFTEVINRYEGENVRMILCDSNHLDFKVIRVSIFEGHFCIFL